MSRKKEEFTRREALKGLGVIVSLPVLSNSAIAQHQHHETHRGQTPAVAEQPEAYSPRFFSPDEYRTVAALSDRIIPEDEQSPGAKAAGVDKYIDMLISESTELARNHWRDGLAAINRMSRERYGKAFHEAGLEQQNEMLAEISRNERAPVTTEERFFRTVKLATVDGYYTSEIGIHQELKYKGNAYLREFEGCTHESH